MNNESFERVAVALGVEKITRRWAESIIELLDDKKKTFKVDWDGIRTMAVEIINVIDDHREWKEKKAAETYQKARANHGKNDIERTSRQNPGNGGGERSPDELLLRDHVQTIPGAD